MIVDQDEREKLIREGAAKAAEDAGLTLLPDEGLVVENAGLTEWPVPLVGRFDEDYPRRAARGDRAHHAHQPEIFRLHRRGRRAGAGVRVRRQHRGERRRRGDREGNARVLAARLADARFFWEQDVKVPLEEQAKKLAGIVFHDKLGTVADKVERVAKLARWLVEEGIVKSRSPTRSSVRRGWPRPTSSPGWSASSPNCRA